MTHPFTFTTDICNTIWGQRVSATFSQTYDGKWNWTLTKHASSQRDEDVSISGLPDQILPQWVVDSCKRKRLEWNEREYKRVSGFKP